MSNYSSKLLNGKSVNSEDWQNLLLRAHENSPGMSPKVFADLKTENGENSYQVLANLLKPLARETCKVVDLACGNGPLVPPILKVAPNSEVTGIDMSKHELRLARDHYKSSKAHFLQENAAKMSLESHSTDAVLCHMAFMLMSPIEPIVSELSRILKHGGLFAAVVGSPLQQGPIRKCVANVLSEFFQKNYKNMSTPLVGGPRVKSLDGLKELFNKKTGFHDPQMSDFIVSKQIRIEHLWNRIKDMYLIGMLSEQEQLAIKEEIIAKIVSQSSSSEMIFDMQMRLITVVKT